MYHPALHALITYIFISHFWLLKLRNCLLLLVFFLRSLFSFRKARKLPAIKAPLAAGWSGYRAKCCMQIHCFVASCLLSDYHHGGEWFGWCLGGSRSEGYNVSTRTLGAQLCQAESVKAKKIPELWLSCTPARWCDLVWRKMCLKSVPWYKWRCPFENSIAPGQWTLWDGRLEGECLCIPLLANIAEGHKDGVWIGCFRSFDGCVKMNV